MTLTNIQKIIFEETQDKLYRKLRGSMKEKNMSNLTTRVWDKTIFEGIANRHSIRNTVEYSIKDYDFSKNY
jgi:hypothetical protein